MKVPTELIESFAQIITDWQIISHQFNRKGKVLKMSIEFIDGSILRTFEAIFFDSNNERYGFQWMNDQNQTIFRWDNIPHFPEFATFPFHRHIDENEIPEPFQQVNLEDVLLFIAQSLNQNSHSSNQKNK